MQRTLVAVLVILSVARFGQVAYRGLTYSIGDFHASMPGAHVERLNPAQWASADLNNVQGRAATYLRGPTQYLTIFPLVYLDSYAEIALVLLIAYALLVGITIVVMRQLLSEASGAAAPWWLITTSTLFYFPLLQAYVAREFEVVIVAATALAFWAAVRDRQALAGAWFSYIAFYKYLPVAVLPYLVLRRWWRALAGYAIASAVLLGLAEWAFGLVNFANNHIPGIATNLVTGLTSTKAFCDGPDRLLRFTDAAQETSMRFALCGIAQHVPFSPELAYLAIVALAVGLSGYGFFRAERARPLLPADERWRRVWELSLILIAYTTFFYSHYYYLCVLIIPINALLVRAWQDWPRKTRMVWWGAAYLLLTCFLLPPSFTSRLLQVDVLHAYMKSYAYFAGELLLTGLVLREYLANGVRRSSSAAGA